MNRILEMLENITIKLIDKMSIPLILLILLVLGVMNIEEVSALITLFGSVLPVPN